MRWISILVLTALPAHAAAQGAPVAAPAAPPAQVTPDAAPAGGGQLATPKERLSYAMGMDLGSQLKARSVDIDPALFEQGLRAALAGTATLLTTDEAKAVIAGLQKSMVARQAAVTKAVGDKNKAEGEAFLAANKAKDGVVTLPSGVQYKVLTAGTGEKPTVDSTVVCQYRVALIDGKEVDSSYKRGQPATLPVKTIIKGWSEALQLMPVGSRWQVVIPPALAYGERGAGPDIGPNATLVVELELVSIK